MAPTSSRPIVIKNGLVLCMDQDWTTIESGVVVIEADRISYIGPSQAPDFAPPPDAEHIDAAGCLVMPGLINGHCHTAMTLFRGLGDDLDLLEFLDRIWRAESATISPASVLAGSRLGIAELLLSGVTTVQDMYWYPSATVRAASELGIRALLGEVFVDFPGADRLGTLAERLQAARHFIALYVNDDLITPVLNPHSCYTLSAEHLASIADLANETGVRVHIHAHESEAELKMVFERHGTTPLRLLDRLGLLGPRTCIAHGVHLNSEDIELLRERRASVIHCPVSNMKLASGVAPVTRYLDAAVTVGLGTDGASTSNDLSLWMNMRVCALSQKSLSKSSRAMTARQVVAAATSQGADSLSLGHVIGRLQVGMKADLITVECSGAHATPVRDPYSHLVYAARPSDVRDVFVNGRAVVRNRGLTSMSLDDITEAVKSHVAASDSGAAYSRVSL